MCEKFFANLPAHMWDVHAIGVAPKPAKPEIVNTHDWSIPAPQAVKDAAAEAAINRARADDMVNAPPHYRAHPSGVECITVTEHFNFNLGNAIKYLWRAGEKGSQLEDLKKARWYLDREIARLEKVK